MRDAATYIAHLTGTEHGLSDSTIVDCLAGTTSDSVLEFLAALHDDEHSYADTLARKVTS